MRERTLLTSIGLAVLALAVAGIVIVPVFAVVNLIYDGGNGLIPLLVVVVTLWLALAWGLARRRIGL